MYFIGNIRYFGNLLVLVSFLRVTFRLQKAYKKVTVI
jgi:hypothetical protein